MEHRDLRESRQRRGEFTDRIRRDHRQRQRSAVGNREEPVELRGRRNGIVVAPPKPRDLSRLLPAIQFSDQIGPFGAIRRCDVRQISHRRMIPPTAPAKKPR